MVPLSAFTSWHTIIGPQAVNHINQFASVTLFFNLKPGHGAHVADLMDLHKACSPASDDGG
jgi:multidrug efflux pump subunit AcrB